MEIAIIGTGRVGTALGAGWAAKGHAVTFGSRRPDDADVQTLARDLGTRVAAPDQAAVGAEVVVLATPWNAAEAAVRGMGPLAGKVLLDATNPLGPGLTLDGPPSGAERVAGWAPGARVVKAFNTTGAENMADSAYAAGRLAMFLAGDDAEAKRIAAGLAEDLGFEPFDAGGLDRAGLVEALALLWIGQAYGAGLGRDFGFALLRR